MKVLVTAGPTREAIDPVRFISNRSSGKMGYAVAAAFVGRKHQVRLVSGPVCLAPVKGARMIDVVTAREMLAAVRRNLGWCDVLIMAAAVADWRPAKVSSRKLKKASMKMRLDLEPTADILGTIKSLKGRRVFVGFAAETGDPVREAERKLKSKGLDLVVANDVLKPGAGFEVDTNKVTVVTGSTVESWPLMTKKALAARLVTRVEQLCKTRG